VDKIIFSEYINYYSSHLLGKDVLLLQTKGKDEGNHYIYIYIYTHTHIYILQFTLSYYCSSLCISSNIHHKKNDVNKICL
jgi:hypothetical protein